jgi:hypothetical protein
MQSTENDDDSEMEFDLQPVGVSRGRWWWHRLASGLVITLAIVLALELAAIGARPSHSSSTHLTTIQGTTPFLVPDPTATLPGVAVESIPTSCPTTPTSTTTAELGEMTYYAEPAYGLAPVWLLGLSNEQNRHIVHFFRTYPPLTYTPHGWRWRILLITAPGYSASLTFSGAETGTGGKSTSLLMDAGSGLETKLSLNASQPFMMGAQWAEWPVYIYLPTSGCYQLGAQWTGGTWSIDFAAGA